MALGANGGLWIGTLGGGLARFDEGAWQVLTEANSDLPINGVSALAEDASGVLWVGTVGGGLARFYDGTWEIFKEDNSELLSDWVLALTVSADSALWVGTDGGGLARFYEGAWEVFTGANSELPGDRVLALAMGDDGALWVGTDGGLARFDEGAWQVFTEANSALPRGQVLALAQGEGGALWVGTLGSGLARFRQGDWEVFTETNSDLPSDGVWSLFEDADGALWVGTSAGLARFHKGRWQHFTESNSKLPSNWVWSLTEGIGETLWIGTDGGLARFDEGAWQVISAANSDLPSDRVLTLMQGEDSTLWVGTDGGGLARFKKGTWEVFTEANSDLISDRVLALVQGEDSTIWVGTDGGGLARFKEGTWEVFTEANSDLPSDRVLALVQGEDSTIWVGTDVALAHFQEGAWEIFTALDSDFPGYGVYSLAAGEGGTLWIDSDDGLARFQEGAWEVFAADKGYLPSRVVYSLVEGGDGALWVGTLGGLARFQGGVWDIFTSGNSDLPSNLVYSLLEAEDGAIWVGTEVGLARFHEGRWQVFTEANSNLPGNEIRSLAEGLDSAIWVGTAGNGLGRFDWNGPKLRLRKIETIREIAHSEHTFAVRSFDPTYRSPTHQLHYHWEVMEQRLLTARPVLTRRTSEPFLTVPFAEDGAYTIEVRSEDRYGWLSEPEAFEVEVAILRLDDLPWWQTTAAKAAAGTVPLLYLLSLMPLVLLYPRFSWARSLVNSGVFTKFPLLHRLLLNTQWARRQLFALYRTDSMEAAEIDQYIEQSVFPLLGEEALVVGSEDDPLGELDARGRYCLILGRSGTGKSVLMARLRRMAAAHFGRGRSPLPVLVSVPTHMGGGDSLGGAVKTVLRRDGKVELPDGIFDFLIHKGGFLIIVDSLNECPEAASALTSFLNADASNWVVIASQTDVLHHPDIKPYRLAEISVDQARAYLDVRIGKAAWEKLSPPLRSLAHNPKDLDLIAEVANNLGVENLPARRADLYAERLRADTAVQSWVETADPRLEILYSIAFRMLAEQRMLELPSLALWVREGLTAQRLPSDEVDSIVQVLRRSRQFREVKARDRLGLQHDAITFDHELVGKFLASRHLRAMLESESRTKAFAYAIDEAWQDVFFFVIDEADATRLPALLLYKLLKRGGAVPLALVAYAIKTKTDEHPPLPPEVRDKYNEARLSEDIKLTPAA